MKLFSLFSKPSCAVRIREAETKLSESALKLSQSIQAMIEDKHPKTVRLKVIHKK